MLKKDSIKTGSGTLRLASVLKHSDNGRIRGSAFDYTKICLDGQTSNIPGTLCEKIDTYKSILLNPSVHYDQRPKYRNEVKRAIEVVEKLKEKLR